MTLSNFARLILQGGLFVVLGRSLGAEGLGAWAGATAYVSVLVAFAGWGSGSLMIMYAARDSAAFSSYFGNALITVAYSGIAAAALLLALRPIVVTQLPWRLVLPIAIGQLIVSRVVDLISQAFQAFSELRHTGLLYVGQSAGQLIAAMLFTMTTDVPTATRWGWWNLGTLSLVSIGAFCFVVRKHGWPRLVPRPMPGTFVTGWHFSVAMASKTVYNDIDKTLLARLSTLDATGIYAAAYRLIDMATTPIRSLLAAAYPQFFREGAGGLQGAMRLCRRLIPVVAVYGAVASVGLFIIAPAVPLILGREYEPSVEAIRWLFPLVALQGIHGFAADTLTGAGFQRQRSHIQIGAAVINVLLCVVLIPAYSWKGAAWASLATDLGLVLALWGAILRLQSRSARAARIPA